MFRWVFMLDNFPVLFIMIREYLKLARSFNAVLTGISPVMGAIAMEQYDLFMLFVLFIIGFLGHTFGFVFNDIIDYNIDKTSTEITDRPLISGTISPRNAWIFAIICLVTAFVVAFIIAVNPNMVFPTAANNFTPLLILGASAFSIALYDLISKRFPLMDILVAVGIFFFILYGASTQATNVSTITPIAWFVCILGSIQVLFMQIVAGGLKDIENDFIEGAKTTAIRLGVRMKDGLLYVSRTFKVVSYGLQLLNVLLIFIIFIIPHMIPLDRILNVIQWILIIIISLMMFFLSYRLLSMKSFDRKKARKLIGSHYMINFALVPILLMSLNPWAGILVFFPALGFILSNMILHGTFLQPKTM
jgi:4-hydroxybenzoate polyprenyltransferase